MHQRVTSANPKPLPGSSLLAPGWPNPAGRWGREEWGPSGEPGPSTEEGDPRSSGGDR